MTIVTITITITMTIIVYENLNVITHIHNLQKKINQV